MPGAQVRLEEFKKNIAAEGSNVAEAALKSVIQNKPELFAEARTAANSFIKYSICETMEEKKLLDRLQTFIKLLPAELKKLNQYKQRLGAISARHNVYITLEDSAMALVLSIRPGIVTCQLDDGGKRTLIVSDLEEKSRTLFCTSLSKRFKQLPDAAFYIPLLDMFIDDIALKAIPKGFWKTYWDFIAPAVKK